MATLETFLKPKPIAMTVTLDGADAISDRFDAPFVIKRITEAEFDAIGDACRRQVKSSNGQFVEKFDAKKFKNLLIVTCTVTPDFTQADLLAAYGALQPVDCPPRMLLAGESAKLQKAILDLNGFKDPEEIEEEVKNS